MGNRIWWFQHFDFFPALSTLYTHENNILLFRNRYWKLKGILGGVEVEHRTVLKNLNTLCIVFLKFVGTWALSVFIQSAGIV